MQLTEKQITYIKDNFSKLQNLDDLVALFRYVAPFVSPQSRFLHSITPKSIKYLAFFAQNRYKKATILKKSGKVREISMPIAYLKLLQKCLNAILNTVFSELITKDYPAYGFISNRNIVQNAQQHINRNFVLNIDLENFFGSISFRRVKTVLQLPPFNLSDDLAFLIANLCCNENCLPQGSPTSPVLSNMVCQRLDRKLTRFAKENHAKYTRYADDLTFSSKRRDVFSSEEFMIKLTQIIEGEKFIINREKTRKQTYTRRQTVTGLTVNEKVNVSQAYIRELRAMLHNWEKLGYRKAETIFKANYANSKHTSIPHLQSFLSGKLLFLGLVRGKKDLVYLKYQEQFIRLIEKEDIKTIKNKIQNTEKSLISLLVKFRKIAKGSRDGSIKEHFNKLLQNISNQILKQIILTDLGFANPKNIPLFFAIFHKSNGMKYLTHDYDEGVFNYEEILKIAEDDFNTKIKEHPIAPTLYEKIRHFAFEKSPKWSSENIKLGWQVQALKDWCKENKGKHPIEDDYWRENMIDKFKNAIEIRKPNLRTIFEDIISKKLRPEKHFKITLLELEKASFYTDVDQFRNGIRYIFNAINEHSKKRDVEVAFLRTFMPNGQMRKTIKITDIGSVMDIEANRDEFKGDLNSATDNLRGLCEWFIEAKFSNGFFNMCILGDLEQKNKAETIEEKGVLGVTHLLHFY